MTPVFPDPAVEIRNLGFAWPGAEKPLFENLSLTIPRGKTTCLIGSNGSGKTSLLELILGWRSPQKGQVFLEGRPAGNIPAGERGRMMALVPQNERLPFAYTVLDYVLLGRAPHMAPLAMPGQKDYNIAEESLKQAGIASLAQRKLRQLSGGEQRLVLLARALVQKPSILLLDEPANHLDPANRERVKQVLSLLHDMGITLIVSSHEPGQLGSLLDYGILLKKGCPVEMGPVEEVLVLEKLSALYGIPVHIAEVKGRRVIIWGK